MTKLKAAIVVGMLCMATPLLAEDVKTIPVQLEAESDTASATRSVMSYSFVEFGGTREIYDDASDNFTAAGFVLAGSFALPEDLVPGLYGRVGYSMVETEEINFFGPSGTVEVTSLRMGAGYHRALARNLDLNAELDVIQEDAKGKGGLAGARGNDSGYALGLGARFQFIPAIEARAGVRYTDLGEDPSTAFEVSGLFHIGAGFSAHANASTSSDVDSFGIGGRYTFGR